MNSMSRTCSHVMRACCKRENMLWPPHMPVTILHSSPSRHCQGHHKVHYLANILVRNRFRHWAQCSGSWIVFCMVLMSHPRVILEVAHVASALQILLSEIGSLWW